MHMPQGEKVHRHNALPLKLILEKHAHASFYYFNGVLFSRFELDHLNIIEKLFNTKIKLLYLQAILMSLRFSIWLCDWPLTLNYIGVAERENI